MGLYIPNITLADINNPSYHAIIVRNNHRPMLRIEDGNYTVKESYIEALKQEPCEDGNDVMPLSTAIDIILNIDSSDRLRTEAEGVLVRFALRHSCEDCISIKNNQIHLCDSCLNNYPDCGVDNIVFGDGVGNDNICACNKYAPRPTCYKCLDVQPKEPRRKGKWIDGKQVNYVSKNSDIYATAYTYICSECKGENGQKSKYCPHCGVEMEE